MLTPTGITKTAYIEALKAGNATHARITFEDQNVVFNDEDITSDGLTISTYLNSDEDLTIGRAVMSEVTVSLFRSSKTENLKWMDEFKLELGVDISGTTYWVTVGYYIGERPERSITDNVIVFTAHDRMKKFDIEADAFLQSITYSAQNPVSLSTIYSGLCTYCGVTSVSGDELSNIMSRTFTASPFSDNGMTCRDVLAKIAESCGCYARITANGSCKMVWYEDHMQDYYLNREDQFSIYVMELDLITNQALKKTWADLEDFTWGELENYLWAELEGEEQPFKVSALRVKMMEDDVGVTIPSAADRNVYLIVDNELLATSSDAEKTSYLTPLYNRLSQFGAYIPSSVDCIGNWLIEPGDIISLEVGKNNHIRFPVFLRNMTWNGSCIDTYEATGNLNREVISPSNYQRMVSRGRYHIFRNDINQLYSEINDPSTGLATRISQAEDGITLLAESKSTTYIGNTAPTGTTSKPLVEGDLWVDTGNNNRLNRYNGSAWNQCEFSDPNKYTIQSGIDINANGVEITGSKYIHLQADTTHQWWIDEQGLSLKDIVNDIREMQFGGQFDNQDLYADCGVYAYRPNGDTTHGRLAFAASDKTIHGYSYAVLEYNNSTGIVFRPGNTLLSDIGSTTNYFRNAYVYFLNGYGGNIYICPTADQTKLIAISDSSEFTIHGYIQSGNNWIERNIKYYGQVIAISSRDKKRNIKSIYDVGSLLDKLVPVEFIYKNDESNKKHFGLIYEDTVDLLPEICSETETKNHQTEKGIDYVQLVPLLLKEIQDLRKRVAELEKEVKK